MRAKVQIGSITQLSENCEVLKFHGVPKPTKYPEDGSDEDNTFALWSPSISLEMTITNPNLIGAYKPGQKMYLDFTPISP